MSRLRLLRADQARRTLVHRLTPLLDKVRQKYTDYGMRPYQCFLVWTRWSGTERGEGREEVICRVPLLPSPKVDDLTAVALQPHAAGLIPIGSVRLREISQRYSQDLLSGVVMPRDPKPDIESRLRGGPPIDLTRAAIEYESVPEPYEFFYELVEDGRSNEGRPPRRGRFRPMSEPFRNAEELGFNVLLERVSGDMDRDGTPRTDDDC